MDLTTRTRVRGLLDLKSSFTADDALIDQLIADTSARVETLLRRYTQDTGADRTEIHEIGRARKVVFLLGFPVASITSVKYGSTRDFSNVTALTQYDNYNVDSEAGMIRLRLTTPYDPGYVEVQYQGGMGTDTADFVSNYPDLALGVDFEVVNRLKRRSNPQNDVTFQGGGLNFTTELGLGRELRDLVRAYRREGV